MTDGPCICPHCGYNLRAEERIVAGSFAYDPRSGFSVDQYRLKLPPNAHDLLGAIMAANGRIVPKAALLARFNEDATGNMIDVYLCRARRLFSAFSVAFPIATIHGRGVYWNGPPVTAA